MTGPSTPPSVPSAANAPAAAPRIEVRGPKIEKPGNDPRSSVPDPHAAAVPKTTPPAATALKPPVVVPPPPVTKTAAASAAAPAPRIDVRDPKIGHPGNDPRSSVPDPRAAAVPKTTPPAATPLKPPVVVPPPPVTKTAAASAAAPAPRIDVRDPKIGHPGNDPRSSVPDPRAAAVPKTTPPTATPLKPPVVAPAPPVKKTAAGRAAPAPTVVDRRDPNIGHAGNR